DDATARAAYLSEACGENTALHLRVEELLAESGRDTGLLGGPAVAAVDESAATVDTDTDGATPPPAATTDIVDTAVVTEGPGSQIGPYKLLQTIGEGGFGVVYLAEQEKPIRRRVALKVIKAGMDTKAVIARFEAERQALAMMEHRNIARVLDAGATTTGRPFFVMELVKGVPITDYCDQAELSTPERLELFVELCRAIQHAHQKGIIHRDLKPSNVLVTLREDQPVVKVIDFGIAKATAQKLTEKTLFTAYGQMIGTPVYMSPEQAGMSELDVDTRSDVYSLGVLLYELLTGATPIDPESLRGAAFDEMQRLIREETPSKPSTRLSTLADDLRRSVAARRRSNPEELRKDCDGDLDWIVMKALEKERARRYESASAFAQDVERHLNSEPVSAVAPSASYRLQKFVQRNRKAVSVAASVALLLVVATTVSSYLAYAASIAEEKATAALGEKEKARAAEAKERVRAEKNEKLARESAEAATAAKKKAEERLGHIEKANEILGSIFESLDPKEIAESGRPLQDILADHLDHAIEELQSESIGDPLMVARMQRKLARSLFALGKPKKAIGVYERAHAAFTQELGADHRETLLSLNGLAVSYGYSGQVKKALRLLEKAVELQRAKLGEHHPDTLASMSNLAVGYANSGQKEKALLLNERVFELHRAKQREDHPERLYAMGRLAVDYLSAGRLVKARRLLERAVGLQKAKLGEDHPYTLETMAGLAKCYQKMGELDKGHALFQRVFELRKARLGETHPETLSVKRHLEPMARMMSAEARYQKALAASGPLDTGTLLARRDLAQLLMGRGRLSEAEAMILEILSAMKGRSSRDEMKRFTARLLVRCFEQRRAKEPKSWKLGRTLSRVGMAALEIDDYEIAEPNLVSGYQRMVKKAAKIPEGERGCIAAALESLVRLYESRAAEGDEEKAAEYRKILDERKNVLAPEAESRGD
ncbi:MAG: serine/threonine-protein kinase, partial [Planctomycetota bacterium]